ncbi:MAG: sodium/proton-translocating pyrophosphatase, partial [Planctomycetota bacterium]
MAPAQRSSVGLGVLASAVPAPAFAGVDTLPPAFYLAPIGAVVALVMAVVFYRGFMKTSEGDEKMVRIAQAVRDGAYAYLGRQARVVYIVVAVLAVVLAVMGIVGLQQQMTFVGVAIASVLSGLCGFLGMRTATNASARTTHAAKQSLNEGLKVAFRAGAVMGLCVTGFALLDVSVWFFVLGLFSDLTDLSVLNRVTTLTLSFAMGASLQALFARVGGGIYTKAADVGADLVGKVEAGIPEDDARNPATIADNVGDNVGDVAGMGADLYESYYGSILAAMALAASAAVALGFGAADDAWKAIQLVVVAPTLAGLGILCSVVAIYTVRADESASFAQLLKSLHKGVWVSSGMIVAGSAAILWLLVGGIEEVRWHGLWGSIVAGLLAGLVIAWGTEHFTSYEQKPTRRISEQAKMGPATVIIAGVAEGMLSTWVPLLTVVVAIMAAYWSAGGASEPLLGVFGVGIAAVGMLSTLGITLATDAYGPIADNAGGNAEMTHQPPEVRERTDMLDSLGNTTAATGKGFAIGSAALTALALLAAFAATVQVNLEKTIIAADVSPPPVSRATADPSTQLVDVKNLGNGRFLVPSDDKSFYSTALVVGGLGQIDEIVPVDGWAIAAYLPDTEVYHLALGDESQELITAEIVRPSQASLTQVMSYFQVNMLNPSVLGGLFIGVLLVFVFCAMTMNAVGRAAFAMIDECRRQFGVMREQFRKDGMSDEDIADPTHWPDAVTVDGASYPDYANCVAISTGGALREMVVPTLLAVIV